MLRNVQASVHVPWGATISVIVAFMLVTSAAQAMTGVDLLAGDTGLNSPSAQAADTGGDGNGFETHPTYAYANDGKFAVDANSGTNSSTSCTDAGKDRHRFYDYNFSIPARSTISGIAVQLVAKADSTASAPKMCAQLSWDGGKTWTAAKATARLSTSSATYPLGGAGDLWGRSAWSTGDFCNPSFRLRIIDVASATNRTFSLDFAGVQVFYIAPSPTPTATRPSATPTRTQTATQTPISPTETPTATLTETPTPTETPTATSTDSPTPTATLSPTPTPSETLVPTDTPTLVPTATPGTPGWPVAWGAGYSGQTTIPIGLSNVTALAGGMSHSLALKSDGTVVAWGDNSDGQSAIPAGLSGVTAIAAGEWHSLALKSDGTVVAWGNPGNGENAVPVGLNGVVAVASGGYHCLALKNNGTVVAWGNGQTVPAWLSGVVAIAAGGFHNLALKNDGTVVAWGDNTHGQGTVPAGLTGVVAIAAGLYHSLALKNDGTVVAWGDNTYGQSTVPNGLGGVTAIAAGEWHSLALKSDGTVVAWGANGEGQSSVPAWLSGVTAIAAGDAHNLVLVSAPITPTPTISRTPTNTSTPTRTASPTSTTTVTATSTVTPTPTPTFAPLPTDTETPLPTDTETPVPTDTETPVPTATSDCQPVWDVPASPNVGSGNNNLWATSAVSANDIWAVGSSAVGTTAWQMLIEHWDGASWTVSPNPDLSTTSSQLWSVSALSASDVWAVGSYKVNNVDKPLSIHWDGVSWQVVPSPSASSAWNEVLTQVAAISSDDIWAAGSAMDSTTKSGSWLQHWDGSHWDNYGGPGTLVINAGFFTGLAAASADELWAVGDYVDANGHMKPVMQQWNGSTMVVFPLPSVDAGIYELLQVDAPSANDAWAVGVIIPTASTSLVSIIHWDGTAWNAVSAPNLSAFSNGLAAVKSFSSSDAWAAGATGTSDNPVPLFEHWNGVNWTVVDSPAVNGGQLTGVAAIAAREVWGVGYYASATNVQQTLIMHGQCP